MTSQAGVLGRETERHNVFGEITIEVSGLVGRRVQHMISAPGRLVGVIMNPLVMMLAVGYLFKGALQLPAGTTNYIDYLMAGVALQVGLASIGPTAISVSSDVNGGLMDRFRSMPIARASVLISHSIADGILAGAALVVVATVGFGIGWRPEGGIGHVGAGLVLLLSFAYVMVWVGIALGLAVKQAESIESLSALALVLFTFLSSAILSASAFPVWIRPVAEWNPVSAVAQVCRELWGMDSQNPASFPTEHPWFVVAITFSILLLGSITFALRKFGQRV